jgi:precorrin-3B synthase
MRVGENFCPGILHAVPAKDGLLVRIRVPGGSIRATQFSAVAEVATAFADGEVEITSRANIQLRAIKIEDLTRVVQALTSAGLVPSPQHDRVRNIVASPFAGLDHEELIDTRPFVRALDDHLIADPTLTSLSPKFTFAIDGGGRWFSRDTDDLALRAVNVSNTNYFHLEIGGTSSGFCVGIDQAVDCMLEAARICLRVSKEFDIPARGRRIASVAAARNSLIERLSHFLVPCAHPGDRGHVVEIPVGVYPTKRDDFVNIIPSVPLGRLTALQTQRISEMTKAWDGDIKLAPWRGVVLGCIPKSAVSSVVEQLQAVGLSYDGKDGYRGISACAGSAGCQASLADVRGDAAFLARRLFGHRAITGWTVNFSGCDKRCAMRNGAIAELVANQSGYSLKINGQLVASNCSSESAIDTVAACHANMSPKVSL